LKTRSSPGSAACTATPISIRRCCLTQPCSSRADPGLRFAGQITGCEGYVESAAIGLLAGRFAAAERIGDELSVPPLTSAFGALLNHITGGHIISEDEPGKRSFQPMNVNFGLFPPLEPGAIVRPEGGGRFRGKEKAKAKKQAMARRALTDFGAWLGQSGAQQAAE
jgi:methylenetetrahydrofolate--tRNA-(uracil-5-)-methyltransferase